MIEINKNKIILKTETKYVECKDIEGYEVSSALFYNDHAITVNTIMSNGRPVNHIFLFSKKKQSKQFEAVLKDVILAKNTK